MGHLALAVARRAGLGLAAFGGPATAALGARVELGERDLLFKAARRVFKIDGANSGNPAPTEITGSGFPAGYVASIAIDPSDGNNVLVIFSNYGVVSLYSTTNAGSSWTSVAGNLEEHADGSGNGPSCRWAAIVPGSGYLVGTSTGLYSTSGAGTPNTAVVFMSGKLSCLFTVLFTFNTPKRLLPYKGYSLASKMNFPLSL